MISLLNASKGHNPALIIIIIKVLKNLIKRRDSNSELLIMKLTAWPIHHATHDIKVCKAAFISLTECIIYLCSEYFSVLTMFLTSTIMHVCTRLQSDTMLQVSCLALIFLLLIVVWQNCKLLMNNYFSDKENNKIKKKKWIIIC
jgi:hypothetical protein